MNSIRLAALCVVLAVTASTAQAGNREDCLQDLDQALAAKACPLYELELAQERQKQAAEPSTAMAPNQTGTDSFFEQDWRLNPARSRLSMTTVKKTTVTETHSFTALDGSINSAGEAKVTIDLWFLDTNVDIRNVRMRFLFFETFKYPNGVVTAQIDKAKLQDLVAGKPVAYPLKLQLDLHGVKKDLMVDIVITKTDANAVSVASAGPVVIQAADFALTEGVNRISKAAGGIEIKPSASITFDLTFEGGDSNPQLDATRAAAATQQAQKKTRGLSAEECQTRMDVISKTRQIYFRSGSAQIDSQESKPVLDEVGQFINRCPAVAMEISGHTDTDGGEAYNQDLSERRARAVAEALITRDVDTGRITTVGYGYGRPVADNNSSEGKAQNRRIEFNRVGGQ